MKNSGYKISQAEFKGKVLTSLIDIKEDIQEIRTDLKTKACKKDIETLTKQISSIKLTSAIVGGIGGILTFFGLRKI
jgi:hypothetical protein